MLKEIEVAVAKHYGNAPSWKQLYTVIFVAMALTCLVTIISCSIVFGGIIDKMDDEHRVEIATLREMLTMEADNRIAEITAAKDSTISTLKTNFDKVKTGLDEANAALASLRYSYDMAVTRGSIELDELKSLWYVVKDIDSSSGLTTDMLMYSMDQCHRMNVDPNLMWLIFLVEMESSKNNNNKVSADVTNMARILPSTGKDLWEKTLGYGGGSFNKAILDSPYNRIRLAVAHIARDLDAGRSVIYAIDHYFGGNGNLHYGQISRLAYGYGLRVEGVTPIYGPSPVQFA